MAKVQDVYIMIEGYVDAAQQGKETTGTYQKAAAAFNTPTYLAAHQPLQWLSFYGGQGSGNQPAKDPSPSIADRVFRIAAEGSPIGDVFLTGGSTGGRNVLSVAMRLNQKQIPVRYIGIWDAAFDRIERETLDTEGNQEIHAAIQGFENIDLTSSTGALLLRAGEGVARGILGIGGQVIPLPGAIRQSLWDKAHGQAYGVGREESLKDIRRILTQP